MSTTTVTWTAIASTTGQLVTAFVPIIEIFFGTIIVVSFSMLIIRGFKNIIK